MGQLNGKMRARAISEIQRYKFHRGYCIVIKNSTPETERESTTDANALKETFESFDFEVLHRDTSKQITLKAIFEDLRRTRFDAYDCFVCCVLSHGQKDILFGTDVDDKLSVDEIVSKFEGNRSLQGKPKLFFFQVYMNLTDNEDSVDENMFGKTMPVISDYLLFMGALPTFTSRSGTHDRYTFIQILTKILREKGDKWDILQVCSSVSSALANETLPEENGYSDNLISINTLKRLVQFNRRTVK